MKAEVGFAKVFGDRDLEKGSYEPEKTRRRWIRNLLASLASATVAAIFGLGLSLLSLVHLISPFGRSSHFGSLLIAIALPLLVFSAHCLDRIDEVEHEIRHAAVRQKLLEVDRR